MKENHVSLHKHSIPCIDRSLIKFTLTPMLFHELNLYLINLSLFNEPKIVFLHLILDLDDFNLGKFY